MSKYWNQSDGKKCYACKIRWSVTYWRSEPGKMKRTRPGYRRRRCTKTMMMILTFWVLKSRNISNKEQCKKVGEKWGTEKKVRKKREREEAKKRTTRSCLGVTWLDLESSTTLFPGTAIERVRTGPPCSLMTGVLPCSGPTGGLLRKTLIHRPM